jgi:FtsP/CotA-like multicopper oxidase with cupredoxin domain
LTNALDVPEPVSLVFPGQVVTAVEVAVPTALGLLALEAGAPTTDVNGPVPGGTVRYTFTAANAGTYLYHSGTRPDLHIEMGLVGALIVRPTNGGVPIANQAYGDADTAFDVEYLFLLTEMDPKFHEQIETGRLADVETSTFFPVVWFINGRCAPDTMSEPYAEWLPTQPYNSMPMMHPGEKLLMRVIGAGRDVHPFHFHGNNAWTIATDGRVLESAPAAGPDLGPSLFTISPAPGETVDAIFEWTGAGLGWDIYGHMPGDPMEPEEYAPDHGKPFPVTMPENQDLSFGGMWSGSPFLGGMGVLPPGNGSFNTTGGYFYMWHSHTEKEMVNNDVFPGGMMTMLVIEPHNTMVMP